MATSQSAKAVVPASAQSPPTDMYTCDAAVKRKLWFIVIASIVVIIIVSIVAGVVEYNDANNGAYEFDDGCRSSGDTTSGVSTYYKGIVHYYCGNEFNSTANADNCTNLCVTEDYEYYSSGQAFYIPTTEMCYCLTDEEQYAISSSYGGYEQITWDTYCENTTAEVQFYDVSTWYAWEDDCIISDGRPYFLNVSAAQKLQAQIAEIECDEYEFYHDTTTTKELNRSLEEYEYDEEQWMSIALAEHSSIATFNKFALELMSMAAPLWMVESANKAAIDEIKHTRIAFDIMNMMRRAHAARPRCVTADAFPQHQIEIDADYERIAMDVVIGGCFGETMSALTMRERLHLHLNDNYNLLNSLIAEVANDEIRHAALAWTVAKWIIARHPRVTVANREWWHSMLTLKQAQNDEGHEHRVYREVMPALIDRLWSNVDRKTDDLSFYESIIQELQSNMNSPRNQCEIEQ